MITTQFSSWAPYAALIAAWSAMGSQPLFPQAISAGRTADQYWQADYGQFAPLALWGVKDLYREMEALRAEIERLSARLEAAGL